MKKNLNDRQMVNFYVREEFRPSFEKFRKILKKDKRFNKLKYKKASGLQSVVFCNLVSDFVKNWEIEHQEVKLDELREDEIIEDESDETESEESNGESEPLGVENSIPN